MELHQVEKLLYHKTTTESKEAAEQLGVDTCVLMSNRGLISKMYEELNTTMHHKSKQPNFKNGKKS